MGWKAADRDDAYAAPQHADAILCDQLTDDGKAGTGATGHDRLSGPRLPSASSLDHRLDGVDWEHESVL